MNNFCENCGNELSATAKFCSKCGNVIGKQDSTVSEQQTEEKIVEKENDKVHVKTISPMKEIPKINEPADMKNKVLNNLISVEAIIMIVGLFVGNFYTTNAGGGYVGTYAIKGFNIPFSGIWYGIILLLSPVVLLISSRVASLKKYETLLNVGFAAASLVLVFILKSQIASDWGNYGSSASLALGSYVYLLGNLVALVVSGLKAGGYKTDAASLEKAVKNRSVDSLK